MKSGTISAGFYLGRLEHLGSVKRSLHCTGSGGGSGGVVMRGGGGGGATWVPVELTQKLAWQSYIRCEYVVAAPRRRRRKREVPQRFYFGLGHPGIMDDPVARSRPEEVVEEAADPARVRGVTAPGWVMD